MDYKNSGVDIEAGNEVVRRIKGLARGTYTPGVLSELGSFGGLFALGDRGLRNPVLVSSADGVGTKLRLAFMSGIHDTIGADLVNHCVNDILVQGAEPLFFFDYLATGRLDPDVAVKIVEGFARACRENGCALLGGETAEMPGFYADGEYDVAGFIVGAVERDRLIDGRGIAAGDVLIGIPSSGLHTNGYSLARAIVFDKLGLGVHDRVGELGVTVAEALLATHRSYLGLLRPQLDVRPDQGHGPHHRRRDHRQPAARAARWTPRRVIRHGSWHVPPLFQWLQRAGGVPQDDMLRTFNMGVGMILVVSVCRQRRGARGARRCRRARRERDRRDRAFVGVRIRGSDTRADLAAARARSRAVFSPKRLAFAFLMACADRDGRRLPPRSRGRCRYRRSSSRSCSSPRSPLPCSCSRGRRVRPNAAHLAGFIGVTIVVVRLLLWLASPSFLPVTIGPDLVHHLQLIHLDSADPSACSRPGADAVSARDDELHAGVAHSRRDRCGLAAAGCGCAWSSRSRRC